METNVHVGDNVKVISTKNGKIITILGEILEKGTEYLRLKLFKRSVYNVKDKKNERVNFTSVIKKINTEGKEVIIWPYVFDPNIHAVDC